MQGIREHDCPDETCGKPDGPIKFSQHDYGPRKQEKKARTDANQLES